MNTIRSINSKVVPSEVVSGAVTRTNAGLTKALGPVRKAQFDVFVAEKFAKQPLIFGVIVTELLFIAIPLLAFFAFIAGWAIFALAVFVGIMLFWSGVGLFFLVPALLIATGLALFTFFWAVVGLTVLKKVLGVAGYPVPSVRAGVTSLASGSSTTAGATTVTATGAAPTTGSFSTSSPAAYKTAQTGAKPEYVLAPTKPVTPTYAANGSINRVPVSNQYQK